MLVAAKQRCSDGTLPLLIFDMAPPPPAYSAKRSPDPAPGAAGSFVRRPRYGAAPTDTVVENLPSEAPDPSAPPEKKWYERGNVSVPKPLTPRERAVADLNRGAANKPQSAGPTPNVLQKRPNRKWYEYEY
ncbi:MAG: hypothetical protein KF778_07555 [Rhodocyclaceae bacterium]|nr:hypothetical protein [Rhodocyclaceae bacterium]MBX3668247.1 hypothetical protein [Rhodocyclaceae bacterium]